MDTQGEWQSFFMDDLDFLGASFLAFFDPPLDILGYWPSIPLVPPFAHL